MFKSQKTPPCNNLLLDFEKDLFSIIDKIKFANITNDLQQKMLKDITLIKKNRQTNHHSR